MGRVVDERADQVVITSDNPRHEDPADIASQILAGVARRKQCCLELDRGRAIAWALEQAREGDCVLIAGKGHETCQQVEDESLYFDDREAARAWLYANARPTHLQKAA
jgi:UDP-N-acetylmuramoyl-L-alanyl-D-glutamate--2,6-diaminopimelate ligase